MSKLTVQVVAGTEYPGPVFYEIQHVRDGRYERGAKGLVVVYSQRKPTVFCYRL